MARRKPASLEGVHCTPKKTIKGCFRDAGSNDRQSRKSTDSSNVESVEAWMQEMESAGYLPEQQQILDNQLPAYTSFHAPWEPPPCCAFQKLGATSQGTSSQSELLHKSPQFRFISWVVLSRTPDQTLPEQERLTCPMLWCRAKFDPNEYVQLVNHLSGCSKLDAAEYWCPYCLKPELFMEPQLPRKPRNSKKRFLKSTFDAIVKLGLSKNKRKGCQSGNTSPSKRLFRTARAEHHPPTARVEDDSTTFPREKSRNFIEHPKHPELGSEPAPVTELDGQAVMATGPREIMPSEASGAKQRSRTAELPGAVYNLFEMEGQLPSEFIYDRAELSDKRFSYVSHSSEDFSTNSSSPVSPVSPQMWYSTRDFDSPISPSDSIISDPWANVPEQSREAIAQSSQAEALVTVAPTSTQLSNSNLIPPQSEWQQFGSKSPRLVPNIRVDTSCSSGKSTSESSPNSSGGSSAQSEPRAPRPPHVSSQSLGGVPSPLQIEADSRDPKKLVQELRGLFNTLCKLTIAKIHQSPASPVRSAILRSHSSGAHLFDCGLRGLHALLSGQAPQDFWQVFGVSLLAYACGLATSETDLSKHFPTIFSDLLNWAQAITDDGEKRGYVLLVHQLWSPDENCFETVVSDTWNLSSTGLPAVDPQLATFTATEMAQAAPPWLTGMIPGSDMTMIQKDFRTNDELLSSSLNNGVVAQLCKQFLDRYEYLSTDITAGAFDPLGMDAFGAHSIGAAHNLYAIRNNILDRLALIPGLEGFRPIVSNTSMLLETMPSISLRNLELMLLQEGKTGSKSSAIYQRFAEAVRRLVDQTAVSMGITLNRSSYHADDVERIASLHQQLLMQAHSEKLNVSDEAQMAAKAGKVALNFSSASEVESSTSHRPFSWAAESSVASDSPTTNPSSIFMPSNSADAFFEPTDSSLMPFPTSFPGLADEHPTSSPGPSRSTASPFQRPPTSAPTSVPTSVPSGKSTPPASDSAEGTMTCKVCGKVLAGKAVWLPSNMKRHMRELHTPAAKRLVCDVPGCGRAFLRNHNLAHHRKTVHGRGS